MKYLVTGGAGFIGSHLVDALIVKGHQVIVIDNLSTGKKSNLNPRAKFYKKDIHNYKSIKPFFAGMDGVFHLAAMPSVQLSIVHPLESHDINVNGVLNVLMAAKEAGIRRLVFSSSCAVYGDSDGKILKKENMKAAPKSPYALHKYIGEEYAKLFSDLYGVETVNLRYFNVYGPRMAESGPYSGVIKIFLKQKADGKPFTITGDGKQIRDYVFVEDVARANILAMRSKKAGKGEIINIGSGKNYSVNQLADLIGGPKKYIAPRAEMRHALADISKAKSLLGWQPMISLEKGLKLI